MQAVILAGGEGRRLRPLTNDIPKPMVHIAGKPILEYTIRALPKEVSEVVLVVGYKRDVIKTHFGTMFDGRHIVYIEQDAPKGTGHALNLVHPVLRGNEFFLLYADDLYDPYDIAQCLKQTPSLLVKETSNPERFGVCTIDGDNRLLALYEKVSNPPSNLALIGVHVLNHEIFDIEEVYTPNGESNLSGRIGVWAKTRSIHVVKAGFWHPIGYPEDVQAAEQLDLSTHPCNSANN
ncbi:MAG: nucleotidyltransferase family protein [Patescibacteria group bacterium]|nr:nucleotidyltransferase family protein [Patescibacteria group bacterium]MDE2437894.1 nucleotidyltransferase family protein [Patescibacteria group bacterium]